jgi:hypothetical protein
MIVHTYYQQLKDEYDQIVDNGYAELLKLFQESWERQGWQVRALGLDDATANRDYCTYAEAISHIPSLHWSEYKQVSFVRYLAMLQVGGGLMVDLDVINYGFKPEHLPPEPNYTLQRGSGPYGTQYFYGWLCYEFARWHQTRVPCWPVEGQVHWSDMIFLSAAVPWVDLSRNYGEPGWETAPLVHFSNGSLYGKAKCSRADRVQRILAARTL